MAKVNAIVDNTVLSNFAVVKSEDVLRRVFDGVLFTSEYVLAELRQGELSGSVPKRDWKWIEVLRIESQEEMDAFQRFRQRFGSGESSCLSLAISRDFKILTDDLDTRKYAQAIGIPVSGTIGVLVLAVDKKIITQKEGNELLSQMIKHGYYSPYQSLDALLS